MGSKFAILEISILVSSLGEVACTPNNILRDNINNATTFLKISTLGEVSVNTHTATVACGTVTQNSGCHIRDHVRESFSWKWTCAST
jgi:hypothetical protein